MARETARANGLLPKSHGEIIDVCIFCFCLLFWFCVFVLIVNLFSLQVDLTKTNIHGELGLANAVLKKQEEAVVEQDDKNDVDEKKDKEDSDDNDKDNDDDNENNSNNNDDEQTTTTTTTTEDNNTSDARGAPLNIPHRSLLPVASLICDEFVRRLVRMPCAYCSKT
jgi:hypothetical protein